MPTSKATQSLNAAYDDFTAKYGLLNDRKNGQLFEHDSSYYLLCSLENLDENKQLKSRRRCSPSAPFAQNVLSPAWIPPAKHWRYPLANMAVLTCPTWPNLLGAPGNYERITTELSV